MGNEDEELRITIDRNIRSRSHRLELSYDGECRLLNLEEYLMEIKVAGAYPVWLAELLSRLEIFPASFSKYGAVYCLAHSTQKANKRIFCLPQKPPKVPVSPFGPLPAEI